MADNLHILLNQSFATTFAFALKAQNFHFNVEGPNFVEYHKIYDKIYNGTYACLDDFAELIRAMSIYVPGNFEDLKVLSKIEDTRNVPGSKEMLAILLNDCRILLQHLGITYKTAEVANEPAMCALLGDVIRKIKKYEYLLVSASKP